MFKIVKTLICIIWVIDVLDINFVIDGIEVAEFLDETIKFNFWAWFLMWTFIPGSDVVIERREKK